MKSLRKATNRRRHRRFIGCLRIEFVSNGKKYTGKVNDFSLHGMFIRTKYPKAADTVLDIVLQLPSGLFSQLRVRVVRAWVTPTGQVIETSTNTTRNGMGVEIIEKDATYLHFIRYLLWRKSLPKEVSPTQSVIETEPHEQQFLEVREDYFYCNNHGFK